MYRITACLTLLKNNGFCFFFCCSEVLFMKVRRFYCILLPLFFFNLLLCFLPDNGDIYQTVCFPLVLNLTHFPSLQNYSLSFIGTHLLLLLSIAHFHFLLLFRSLKPIQTYLFILHYIAGFATTLIMIPPK